jgi:hypothetical protein
MIWYALEAEQWLLYSQIGLKLVDEFTGNTPKYPVYADLEYQDTGGNWHPVERNPVVTPNGIISYPALGRSVRAATQPVLRHRVSLRSDFYRPEYLLNSDGIEFDIHPYDDANPPVVIPTNPQTILMMPNTKYAYPGHVRLVNGVVQDNAGDPVANVIVSEGVRERVLADERGAFSLPLRWPVLSATVLLDALDHRTGRNDSLNINLPGDLSQGHLFTIT